MSTLPKGPIIKQLLLPSAMVTASIFKPVTHIFIRFFMLWTKIFLISLNKHFIVFFFPLLE